VKADVFIKHYASVSRHKFSKSERKTDLDVRVRLTEDRRNPEPLGPESDNFSMEELVSSLKAGKAKGAEGPDGLACQFLKNLAELSRSFMLDTFKSWRKGVCPKSWRYAVIVPILLLANRPYVLHGCKEAPALCQIM
jgi:hypothetical protein